MSTSTSSQAPPHRGTLIAIEGLDRAGKSTQCSLLLSRLEKEGVPAVLQKFPDRTTPIGQMINSYLQSSSVELDDRAIHLLFSANRWELCSHILQLLEAGTTVVLDRYIYSGIVFSAAKSAVALPASEPLSINWCAAPDVGLPRPDIVLFLNISAEAAGKRAGFGGERYEEPERQKRVRELFTELRAEERWDGDWWVVNAEGSVEEVEQSVWSGVQEGRRRVKERGGEVRRVV